MFKNGEMVRIHSTTSDRLDGSHAIVRGVYGEDYKGVQCYIIEPMLEKHSAYPYDCIVLTSACLEAI